jgi:adenylate cyclase
MGIALIEGGSEARGSQLLAQSRDMSEADRYYRSHIPVMNAWIGRATCKQGDRQGGIALLRPAIDQIFEQGQFGYYVAASPFLVTELLGGTPDELHEAASEFDRLASVQVLRGYAIYEVTLLRLRALLAQARGDEVAHREFAAHYLKQAEELGFELHIAWAKALT